ncbi:MAG: transporter associated domain-containing protein, partial [Burkholderiales bacterium]
DFDTVGGLVVSHFGHVPKRNESISFDGFRFLVLRADSRKVHSLMVERLAAAAPPSNKQSATGGKPSATDTSA